MKLNDKTNWKKHFVTDPSWDGTGIYSSHLQGGLGTEFHEKMPKGAALRELKDVPLHLSFWETPYYRKAILSFLADFHPTAESVALDIGCGDGRFSELLIEHGFQRVIATDAHLTPLISLQNYANEKGFADKLLLIQCDADHLPLPAQASDVILAIGVFYYLNNRFEACLTEAARLLRRGGILINSEPDLEGAVVKSLYFEGIEDALENFEQLQFKEEKGETKFKFRLFSQDEMPHILSAHGFTNETYHGLSLLPSILRIKMVRGEIDKDQVSKAENRLREMFDYFDSRGMLHKHVIWKSKKTN